MFPRILPFVTDWVKAHKQFGLDFKERGSLTWVFVRMWRKENFYRVAVDVIDHFYSNASSELVILGQLLSAIGGVGSLVSCSGGSHTFIVCYKEKLWSGYTKRLLDYSTFGVRLLKHCLQITASSVFRTLNPLSMTKFIVTRLKGAEHRES